MYKKLNSLSLWCNEVEYSILREIFYLLNYDVFVSLTYIIFMHELEFWLIFFFKFRDFWQQQLFNLYIT